MFKFLIFCFILVKGFGQNPAVLIVGTRPEAIKMIPIYKALKKQNVPTILCSTGQHAELLDTIFNLFEVTPDYSFNIMKPDQDLTYITREVLEKAQSLFIKLKPSIVVVQGDTTSAFSAGLAAHYENIPIAHVEAGLRVRNPTHLYPEEMNRRIISMLADYHFSPTEKAAQNLLKEGIDSKAIFITGNTVVDTLFTVLQKIKSGQLTPSPHLVQIIEKHRAKNHKILLLTTHRRESFGKGLQNIFSAIKTALESYSDFHVIYPVHPNPMIQKTIETMGMDNLQNLSLLPPLPYHDLIYLLNQVDGIATDSGGILEEGVSLNKKVFILRNETDRPEGVANGSATLVGTNTPAILEKINHFMKGCQSTNDSSHLIFGDGTAAEKIAEILKNIIKEPCSIEEKI